MKEVGGKPVIEHDWSQSPFIKEGSGEKTIYRFPDPEKGKTFAELFGDVESNPNQKERGD